MPFVFSFSLWILLVGSPAAFALDGAAADEDAAPLVLAQAQPSEDQPQPAEEDDFDEASQSGDIAPPAGVEVFRVKGRGVSAIETDVPTSVTQFDAAAIEALGAQNVSDLAQVTPNVEIRTAGATTPTFFIRGVGLADFNANAAGAVSIYQDDVAINAPAMQLGLLFDLIGVDVQRGPQASGPSRNASAGAIRVSSRRPTGQLNANASVSYGNYNFRDVQGALELPLMEDWGLSMRTAFRYSARDGFMRNGCAGGPSIEERFDGTTLAVVADPNDPTARPRRIRVADDPTSTTAGWFRFGAGLGNPPLVTPTDGQLCGEELREVVWDAPTFNPSGRSQLVELSTVPGGLDSEFGNRNRWAIRSLLRWEPEDLDMDWTAKGHYSKLDEDTFLAQSDGTQGGSLGGATIRGYSNPDVLPLFQKAQDKFGPGGGAIADQRSAFVAARLAKNLDPKPRRGDYNRPGDTTLEVRGASLKGDILIDNINLRVISAYDSYKRFRVVDTDGTPDILFESVTDDEAWQFYQEIGVKGESEDEPFKWNAGGYYLMEELDNDSDNFSRFNDVVPQNRLYTQNTWSFGAYAGMEWDFLDDFTLESGIRYNWERKQFDHKIVTAVDPPIDNQKVSWEAPTGFVTLRYRFTEDASAYWKYSRGWKPGHFNASASLAREVSSAEPEKIDSFELGMQGRWFDGRYSLSASGFFYKYTQYQVFIVNSEPDALPEVLVVNADDAQIYGVEAEFRAEPFDGYLPPQIDGLVVTGRFGWLESQFLDFQVESEFSTFEVAPNGQVRTLSTRVINNYSGNRLINSPEFSFSLSAEWVLDFARWGQVVPQYDFIWSDEVYFDQSEGKGAIDPKLTPPRSPLPKFAVGQKETALHNLRLGYRFPGGNMEVAGWVRNLTDETTRRQGFDASVFSQVLISFVGEPRTYGLDVSFDW